MTSTPNFLVIGTPKSGSTWLQLIMAGHPDIFIPEERNEIHFFDRYIKTKPFSWYLDFFNKVTSEKAIGEVTPHYLFIDEIEVFQKVPSLSKFIVILRHPVERCVSHYKFRIRVDNYKGTLQEFVMDYSHALKWGEYGKWLKRFLEVYSKEQLLVLFFEEVTKDSLKLTNSLAEFLEVDQGSFNLESTTKRVNQGFKPKYPVLYKLGIKFSKLLLKWDLYKIRNMFKSSIKRRLSVKTNKSTRSVSYDERAFLFDYYEKDINDLRMLLGALPKEWELQERNLGSEV